MIKNKLEEIISQGEALLKNGLQTQLFQEYMQEVKDIASKLKNDRISRNEKIYPVFDQLIDSSENSYKTNFLTRFFYFKKYQYIYKVNPTSNKDDSLKMRYIIETNEILTNLKDM